jgi:hypothetical protein
MRSFVRFTLLALALLITSCADQAPVEPVRQTRQFSAVANSFDELARYQSSGSVQITIGFAMKLIGPQGGHLSLAGFEVIVPPGAVSKLTLFSIRLPLDASTSQFVRAEFGPHMQFATPVTIRLPQQGTTAEGAEARILWWNGYGWEAFPTSQTGDGRIETQTSHFSEYGTEDPTAKGIILVGGGK